MKIKIELYTPDLSDFEFANDSAVSIHIIIIYVYEIPWTLVVSPTIRNYPQTLVVLSK